jgi:hypothetical protein
VCASRSAARTRGGPFHRTVAPCTAASGQAGNPPTARGSHTHTHIHTHTYAHMWDPGRNALPAGRAPKLLHGPPCTDHTSGRPPWRGQSCSTQPWRPATHSHHGAHHPRAVRERCRQTIPLGARCGSQHLTCPSQPGQTRGCTMRRTHGSTCPFLAHPGTCISSTSDQRQARLSPNLQAGAGARHMDVQTDSASQRPANRKWVLLFRGWGGVGCVCGGEGGGGEGCVCGWLGGLWQGAQHVRFCKENGRHSGLLVTVKAPADGRAVPQGSRGRENCTNPESARWWRREGGVGGSVHGAGAKSTTASRHGRWSCGARGESPNSLRSAKGAVVRLVVRLLLSL